MRCLSFSLFCYFHLLSDRTPNGSKIFDEYPKRCDDEYLLSCPVCGFTPCHRCHGGGKKLNSDKPCYTCKGSGKQPFKLREVPRTRHDNFKERMLVQAKEFATRSQIRYLYISANKNRDYVSLEDIRYGGYSLGLCALPKEKIEDLKKNGKN